MMKRTKLAFGLSIMLMIIGIILINAQTINKKVIYVKIPNNVQLLLNDSIYVTNNDSVKCTYTINDAGLIIFSQNEFEIHDIKLNNNHPNYGYMQHLMEYYFNFENSQYLMLPKGKLVSNKQEDINNYGAPISQSSTETEITLEWTIEGKKLKKVYDRYGKFLYEKN